MIRSDLVALAGSLAIASSAFAANETDLAPRLDHRPLKSVRRGDAVLVQANITSLSGKPIYQPTVFVRPAGLTSFVRVEMKPDPRVGGFFVAEIPQTLANGDFDYYVEAFDEDGNGPSRVGTPDAPIHVTVTGAASDVPLRQQSTTQSTSVPVTVTRAPEPPHRSRAPTVLMAVFGGLAASVAAVSGVVFSGYSTTFNTAVSNNTTYPGSDYVAGQTAGTVTWVSATVAVLLVAGAVTYAVWPSKPASAAVETPPSGPTPPAPPAGSALEPPRSSATQASLSDGEDLR